MISRLVPFGLIVNSCLLVADLRMAIGFHGLVRCYWIRLLSPKAKGCCRQNGDLTGTTGDVVVIDQVIPVAAVQVEDVMDAFVVEGDGVTEISSRRLVVEGGGGLFGGKGMIMVVATGTAVRLKTE